MQIFEVFPCRPNLEHVKWSEGLSLQQFYCWLCECQYGAALLNVGAVEVLIMVPGYFLLQSLFIMKILVMYVTKYKK